MCRLFFIIHVKNNPYIFSEVPKFFQTNKNACFLDFKNFIKMGHMMNSTKITKNALV